jgi:transcription elongation factor Elf1
MEGPTNWPAEKDRAMESKVERREVCKCEQCGNEAEMVVTCELLPVDDEQKKAAGVKQQERKTFTCSHCGNEADMIVDL